MRPVVIALVALSAGSLAQAQDPRLGRLDPSTRTTVAAVLDSARAAGLPTEPLVDRALEGVAKGASAEAIVGAVRRLAGLLARSRDALGRGASAPEVDAGAAALRAGAEPAVLAALRRSRPRQSLTVPLGVLADLVASGVPVDTAAAAVLALARAADDDLLEFRRSVEHDIALGVRPGTAADVRVGVDRGTFEAGSTPGGDPAPRPRRP